MKRVLAFTLALTMTLLVGVPALALPKKTVVSFPLGEFGIPALSSDGKPAAYDAKLDDKGNFVSGSTVAPGTTIYFPVMKPSINPDGQIGTDVWSVIMIPPEMLFDSTVFTFTANKGKSNSKMISSIKLSTKKLENDMDINGRWIEVKLSADTTGEKFKIAPSFTFTAKKDLTTAGKYQSWDGLDKQPLENRIATVAKSGDTVIFPAGGKIVVTSGDYYVLKPAEVSAVTPAKKAS